MGEFVNTEGMDREDHSYYLNFMEENNPSSKAAKTHT